MAKTFGLLARLRRNNRILTTALGGTLVYACAIAAAIPVMPELPMGGETVEVQALVASTAMRPTLAAATQNSAAATPRTVVRNLVNRPSYQTYVREKDCLATAIYFEARGESAVGQKAVAEVVVARTRVPGRPRTICGVVYEGSHRKTGCQFSFTCDGVADRVRDRDAWRQAMRIAANVMRTGGKVNPVAGGATFYHADYVSPSWASRMVKVAEIGTHIFYRPLPGRNL
jgi:spore germination cell wall hydrolase CwlJ-like protein